MTTYLTRDELLGALTGVHEKTIRPRLFGGRPILIREITARQRLTAQQAASAENPDTPDNALYRAMLIQMAVVDPASGAPYADGRLDPLTGSPAIDPRTRSPLLTLADVEAIADGRDLLIDELVTEIASLAALGPSALKRGHPRADRPQRDAGAGAETGRDAARADEDEGTGDAGERGALAPLPAGEPGDEPGDVE